MTDVCLLLSYKGIKAFMGNTRDRLLWGPCSLGHCDLEKLWAQSWKLHVAQAVR